MRYAHLADIHLGSWREDKLRHLSTQAFLQAMDNCIKDKVDFILIAGDLFNTSLPSLDILKIATKKLRELRELHIPIYAIPGSHDFSPSGKTMLDILENAALLTNVCKGKVNSETKKIQLTFTTDKKTGAKITGIMGRKGMLDRTYYENLDLELLEQEPGYKIFMFHTAITELKPKHLELMETQPISFLPKKFNYYAGGHVHHPTKQEQPEYGIITSPGALFPNNFAEIEKYSHGGYYLIIQENNSHHLEWMPVKTINHQSIILNCNHKTPEIITFEILNTFHNQDLTNTLITIRLEGTLDHGKILEIDFKTIFQKLTQQGAYFMMKNTAKLNTAEFEQIAISSQNPEFLEEDIIKEHLQQKSTFDKETEFGLIKNLIQSLNTTKKEGETNPDFQKRIASEMNDLLQL